MCICWVNYQVCPPAQHVKAAAPSVQDLFPLSTFHFSWNVKNCCLGRKKQNVHQRWKPSRHKNIKTPLWSQKKGKTIGWFTLEKEVCLQSQHALIFKDVSHINRLWLPHSKLLYPITAAVRVKRHSWFFNIRKGSYSINLHVAFPSMSSSVQCLKLHCLAIFTVLKSYLA